jgi:multiple sugar transport system permease protein
VSKKQSQRRILRVLEPWFLLAPAIIFIILLMGYPMIYSIRLSFLNYNIMYPDDIGFAGFDNYKNLVKSPEFGLVLRNSFVWVVTVVITQFMLGMTLALLLNSGFRGKRIYQSVVFLPWAVSGFLIGLVFKWIFNERAGIFNFFLIKTGFINIPVSWLGDTKYSMIGPITGMIWYGVPFFGIMILAALQSIPKDVSESALLDGAGRVSSFLKITIPYIRPVIIITLLLRVIWVFNSPDILYAMTSGGPAYSSSTLPLYVYNKAFASLDFGYGAATGIFIMVFLVLYAVFFLAFTKYDRADDF